MPQWSSFNAYARELAGLEGDLTGTEQRAITKAMARSAAAIAVTHARRSLGGDAAFSGWKGADRALSNLKIKQGADNVHWVFPTRKSGGPWKVAQQGRHQGDVNANPLTAGKFFGPSINRLSGETFRTKTGKVRQTRGRRTSRWNGRTQGKNTATDAVADMQSQLPKVAAKAVLKVTRKRFTVT